MLWIVLGLLFFVPLLRALRPLWRLLGLVGGSVMALLGESERRLSRPRELLLWLGLGALLLRQGGEAPVLPIAAALLMIGMARSQRRLAEQRFAEWLRLHDWLAPEIFFRAVSLELSPGGLPSDFSLAPAPAPVAMDYRDGAGAGGERSFLPVLRSFLHSAWLTTRIIDAEAWLGPDYFRDTFDCGARLWGASVLRLARSQVRVEGLDKLRALSAGDPPRLRRLFLFSHVSQTDFAIGFPAFACLAGTADEVRLRFVVAKDHFVDNPIIHDLSGLGRVVEASGMVAIDRGNSASAIATMQQAARRVADECIDLAIYPQGTRARAHIADDGSPLDAGFYNSAKPSKGRESLGHFKNGSSFLALDALATMRGSGEPLHLVCIGIEGAGKLMPKGTLKMGQNEDIVYRIGEVISLDESSLEGLPERALGEAPDELWKARAVDLSGRIERALARACRIDERLALEFGRRYGREMPDSAALRRLYDHALSQAPEKRVGLLEAIDKLGDAPDEQAVLELFGQL